MDSHPSGSSKLDRNGALGLFGSIKATCNCVTFTSCDSENTTGSVTENEPTASEKGLGMFGRQEGSEKSSVNLTSRLSGGQGSKPEISDNRVEMQVTREETEENPNLLQNRIVCGSA